LAEDPLKIWETLFDKALKVIDSGDPEIFRPEKWSFGGGTVLMRRYRHRLSKDIDIFVPDPQYLGYLSPRLNDTVDGLVSNHVEQATFLKLYFKEGEVDFIVSPPLTKNPTGVETTSEWYMQAFPNGTQFDAGNPGIVNWIWTYTYNQTAKVGSTTVDLAEFWVDSANGDGQLPADGNIDGNKVVS